MALDIPYLCPDEKPVRSLAKQFEKMGFPYVNVMSTKLMDGDHQGFFVRTLTATTDTQDVKITVKEDVEDGKEYLYANLAFYYGEDLVSLYMCVPRSETRYVWSGMHSLVAKALQERSGQPSRSERKRRKKHAETEGTII